MRDLITMGDRIFHGRYDYHGRCFHERSDHYHGRYGFPWEIWLTWETVSIGDMSFHGRYGYHGKCGYHGS